MQFSFYLTPTFVTSDVQFGVWWLVMLKLSSRQEGSKLGCSLCLGEISECDLCLFFR